MSNRQQSRRNDMRILANENVPGDTIVNENQ